MSDQKLVSPRIAAEHYGVTRPTIYRWIRTGKLPGIKQGGIVRVRIVESPIVPAQPATAIPPTELETMRAQKGRTAGKPSAQKKARRRSR